MKCAIIGAGIAGLACAEILVEAGIEVQLFDKGRGPGGRLSSRRVETDFGALTFDHGAQYLTATSAKFRAQLEIWTEKGVAAPWPAEAPLGHVGVPTMSAIIKEMSRRVDVSYGRLVKGLMRSASGWHLCFEDGTLGPFDMAIVAIPAEQAAVILGLHDLAAAKAALTCRSEPCWTAMFSFPEKISGPDLYHTAGSIASAVRNSSKPCRATLDAWVVQANYAWTRTHIDQEPTVVAELLLEEFRTVCEGDVPSALTMQAHRWKYALNDGLARGSIWNADLKIGACGDWLVGPRAEDAWQSGRSLAWAMIESLDAARMADARASLVSE